MNNHNILIFSNYKMISCPDLKLKIKNYDYIKTASFSIGDNSYKSDDYSLRMRVNFLEGNKIEIFENNFGNFFERLEYLNGVISKLMFDHFNGTIKKRRVWKWIGK